MFYPVESLRRGGRFYLCWIADSWPLRFQTIAQRQLWSYDIRKICDDLLEVMTNESGRPVNRFSLRLSSQLLRGLVRLYQRKVNILIGDLCMIHANVTKRVNKKYTIHTVEISEIQLPQPTLQRIEEIQEEPRVEELIQNSINVVRNIQDITLKESSIPEYRPPVDGFGEEHPEQALQLLKDQTVEMMLAQPDSSAVHHSGLALPLDTSDKSHDKSRLFAQEARMEKISEYDVTLFGRPSAGEGQLPVGDFEKDIPEIPEILPPEVPAPQTEIQEKATEVPEIPVEAPRVIELEKPKELEEIELEEIEEQLPAKRRRRIRNKLIIDKTTKLSTNVLRSRIQNVAVELRCEDSSDDIVDIRLPWEQYVRRPCHAGFKLQSRLGLDISRLYLRNLGVVNAKPLAEREMEEAMPRPKRSRLQQTLGNVVEVEEPVEERSQPIQEPLEAIVSKDIVLDVTEPRVSEIQQVEGDIADMPTQKLETLSQRKRAALEDVVSPKRQRSMGYMSFRESRRPSRKVQIPDLNIEAEKENLPIDENICASQALDEKNLTQMLQQIGLADIQHHPAEPVDVSRKASRRQGSETSETPLGSLDRTRVSLGDTEKTTESRTFIRDQWGTEGTMIKILKDLKAGYVPITIESLLARGPIIPEYKRIIAARCFSSILKLKQHGFIKIRKDPETLELKNIELGPKFD